MPNRLWNQVKRYMPIPCVDVNIIVMSHLVHELCSLSLFRRSLAVMVQLASAYVQENEVPSLNRLGLR